MMTDIAQLSREETGEQNHTPSVNNEQAILSRRSLRLFESSLSDDSDDSDTDLEEDDLTKSYLRVETRLDDRDVGQHTYTASCKRLNIRPIKAVLKQLWCRLLDLRFMGIDSTAAKSISLALLKNSHVEIVDLEGNDLGNEGCVYVSEMMICNDRITTLNLCQNNIATAGIRSLGEALLFNTTLIDLDISCNLLKDVDAEYIGRGLAENTVLQWLDLSGNSFCADGMQAIAWALKLNSTLVVLDVSWNHIRKKGAVWLCKGLLMNRGLESVNLSWNGLGYEGCLALKEVLANNTTLKRLDISNNRIDWHGIHYICSGLRENRTLESLNIGQNTITMDGCYSLIDIASRESSALTYIGFEGIPINSKVAFKAEDLAAVRDFSITHGGIVFTDDIFGISALKKAKKEREDPMSLMVRYLSRRGIRVVDLFRSVEADRGYYVSSENFIRGLKRVQVPLDEDELKKVIKHLQNDKNYITYRDLAMEVRKKHREYLLAHKRQENEERKRRRDRRRILAPDIPGFAKPAIPMYPTPYSLIEQRSSSSDYSSSPSQGHTPSSILSTSLNAPLNSNGLPKIIPFAVKTTSKSPTSNSVTSLPLLVTKARALARIRGLKTARI